MRAPSFYAASQTQSKLSAKLGVTFGFFSQSSSPCVTCCVQLGALNEERSSTSSCVDQQLRSWWKPTQSLLRAPTLGAGSPKLPRPPGQSCHRRCQRRSYAAFPPPLLLDCKPRPAGRRLRSKPWVRKKRLVGSRNLLSVRHRWLVCVNRTLFASPVVSTNTAFY